MEDVCRTCLRASKKLVVLYSDLALINKIQVIAPVQLIKSDDYPSMICQECVCNVNKLYNFRKVIINSDKELRERKATLERIQQQEATLHSDFTENYITSDSTDLKNEDQLTKFCDNSLDSFNVNSPSSPEIQVNITKSFKSQSALGAFWKCKQCNKSFASRFNLRKHKQSQHVKPGICNVCGIVVRSDNLRRHVQLHLEPTVQCKDCGKIFKNSESLRGHTLIHRGITYTCEICEKKFKVKSEYKRHIKSHTDPENRKIMCTLCGKRVRDIKRHMQSHTGERPYLCVICSKGFTSSYSLKVHTRQHTNEKPFICDLCPMAFTQKVSLLAHHKSKHKNDC